MLQFHQPVDANAQGYETFLYWSVSTKFTPSAGVNFTNILRAAFLNKSFVRSFFVLAVKVKLFIGARILAQMHL
jgi:hypothetical protein